MRDVQRPAPTRDLDTPEEIAEMVRRFYADVAQDDLLGPMFNDVARVDWSEHLPKLAAFWCRALLGLARRRSSPVRTPGRWRRRRRHQGAGDRPARSASRQRRQPPPPAGPVAGPG